MCAHVCVVSVLWGIVRLISLYPKNKIIFSAKVNTVRICLVGLSQLILGVPSLHRESLLSHKLILD